MLHLLGWLSWYVSARAFCVRFASVYGTVVTFVYSTAQCMTRCCLFHVLRLFIVFFVFFLICNLFYSLSTIFLGSLAARQVWYFCTCFVFVFHMKCVFIWNLAIFIFYLKNFHMKWFFYPFQFKWKWSLSLSHILQMHCICFSYEICFYMKFVFIWNLAIFMFYLKNFHMKRFFWFLDLFQFKWKWFIFLSHPKVCTFTCFKQNLCCVISYKKIFWQIGEVFWKATINLILGVSSGVSFSFYLSLGDVHSFWTMLLKNILINFVAFLWVFMWKIQSKNFLPPDKV